MWVTGCRIGWGEGWAPIGLFCATAVSLLSSKSQFPWKITEFVSGKISKLYKNHLEFSIGFIAGSITLVNTMKQFEVHPSSTFPTDLLPLIWQAIDRALKEVCSKYSYKASHQFAFACTCAVPSHAALISTEKSTVQCTRDGTVGPLSTKQKLWLFLQDYGEWHVSMHNILMLVHSIHSSVYPKCIFNSHFIMFLIVYLLHSTIQTPYTVGVQLFL